MSKVTMQDIADALGVSRVTVWKAFNNHDGVSAALKESIMSKAKELGYPKVATEVDNKQSADIKTVALVVSRPDSSIFWTNIIHRLAQELSLHDITLMYTYVPSSYTEGYTPPAVLNPDMVDGIIVLNVYDEHLLNIFNDIDIPKVFLDTVPTLSDQLLTGDLFIIEGYQTEYAITEHLIKKGLKKLAFIGDIQYARTNMERYAGFVACMKDYHLPVDSSLVFTDRISIEHYPEQIHGFLDSLTETPEAIICVSDYVAHYVEMYLSDHPYAFPNGILLTGFDCSKEYSNVIDKVTTVDVKTNLLGKRLAVQIMYRMEHPLAPTELTFIRYNIVYSNTLLP